MLLAFAIILLGGWAIGNGHWIGFVAVVAGVVWWLVILVSSVAGRIGRRMNLNKTGGNDD